MNVIALIALIWQISAFPFSTNPTDNWFTDLTAAKEYAHQQNGQILMVFAGSDWCRPCIKFKKDILLSEDFQNYSQGKISVLYLDFPARKKNRLSKEQTQHNEALAERYNKSGAFPKIILLAADETVISNLKYDNQSPEVFIQQIKNGKQ